MPEKVIFRRPLAHPAVADDLRPTRSKAGFNGIMQATTQPESELLLSISRGFASAAHQGALQRVPYGAPPRMPLESITPPAQMAAIKPHNAWCTFVTWVPPADGSDHDEFTYELNLRQAQHAFAVSLRIVGEENSLLVTGIGQEPQVQLNGLESGKTYEFQEWDEPCSQGAPIIGYRIQYSLDPSDEGASETITSLHRRTNLVVSDLKPSHLYFFRVQALNEVGCSEWTTWSDGIATKVVGPEIPDAPTLVQAKPRDLTITWSEPHTCGFRLIGYDVKVSREDPSMKEALILPGDERVVRTHQLQLSDLEPLHDYYFQVSGPFKTCMSAPEPCTELQVTANQLRQVGLSFQTPDTHRLPIQNFMVRWLEKGEDYLLPEELGRYEVPMEPAMMDIGTPVSCTVPGIPPGSS
ncbi:Ttn [Symbiodinium sp. KB8]|nr:Ttn [Symbiodinium sp. KB8]